MAGIHSDHTVHRVVSGETPVVGLRVLTNDLKWGTISKVDDEPKWDGSPKLCGYYCESWHRIELEGGGWTSMNCDRLSTKMPARL